MFVVSQVQHRKEAGQNDRYRPSAQDRQMENDDFFEYRFDAFLNCKDFVWDIYKKVLYRQHAKLFLQLEENIMRSLQSKDENIIGMTIVTTGLSDPDRSHLIDASTQVITLTRTRIL